MKKLALIAMMAAAVSGFGATLPADTLELMGQQEGNSEVIAYARVRLR